MIGDSLLELVHFGDGLLHDPPEVTPRIMLERDRLLEAGNALQ